MSLASSLLVRNLPFRRIWTAGLLSDAGSEISRISLVLYLAEESGTVAGVALLVVARTLPSLLAAPVLVALADRCRRGRVMIAADVARALVTCTILASPSPVAIYLAMILDAIAAAVFEPARAAALPQLVDARDVLRANGLARGAANATMVLGPLAGAELYVRFGLVATLLIDALSFVASALLIGLARIPDLPAVRADAGGGGVRAVLGYLARHDVALHVVALQFVSMLCAGLWLPLAPFFIRDVLGASERWLGLQHAAFGLGGVLGGLVAVRLPEQVRAGGLLVGALFAEGAHVGLYALVPDPVASLAVLSSWGAAVALIGTTSAAILQRQVAAHYLGRVFTMARQAEHLALLLAMALASALTGVMAVQTIFLLAGMIYCGAVLTVSHTAGGRALRVAS
jgi:predicted MFS family arabinose efflux permease